MSKVRWVAVASIATTTACALPHDTGNTLERVRGDTMHVGVAHNPPWVVIGVHGEPSGVEPALVRGFARELGATVRWYPGGESELLEALQHRQLDLVIAGLTRSTPWSKHVVTTNVYHETPIAVGLPPAWGVLDDVDDVAVAVPSGTAIAHYVRAEGGIPVPMTDLDGATGPVAVPYWRLERLGLVDAKITLHTDRHVMAVPPGESAWLVRLEQFLHRHRSEVRSLLAQVESVTPPLTEAP